MRYALIGLVLLSGCAYQWEPQAKAQIAAGQCNAARETVRLNEHDQGNQFAFTGSVYADCDHDMRQATRYWTLAARYGNAWAVQTLAELRAPVPAADLAPRAPTIVNNTNHGSAPAADRSVTCETKTTGAPMSKSINTQTTTTECR